LKFRARLKGLTRARSRERVSVVMEQCGLTDVGRKIIGQLSMGYRQRVGLADALAHEPDLIILDEPTLGLDPHQIRSVRQLIKSLGGQHTVLISTHILPEVEMTCDHVLILHEGKILAADSPAKLQDMAIHRGCVITEIAAPAEALQEFWSSFEGVAQFEVSAGKDNYCRCLVTPQPDTDLRSRIFSRVHERGWTLRELTWSRTTLEDIFVQVTHKPMPEEEEEEEY